MNKKQKQKAKEEEKKRKKEETKKYLEFLQQQQQQAKQYSDDRQFKSVLSLSQRQKKIKKDVKWNNEQMEQESDTEKQQGQQGQSVFNIFKQDYENYEDQGHKQVQKVEKEEDIELEMRAKRLIPELKMDDFTDYQAEERQKRRKKVFEHFIYEIEDDDLDYVEYEDKDLVELLKSSKFRIQKCPVQNSKKLPIYQKESDLVEHINNNLTTIVCGSTGCGKSTQIPQILHEYGFDIDGKIGITQPRRIAAISLAQRVGDEMGYKLGQEIEYQVRYDKKVNNSQEGKIKYMTDGILMNELGSDFLLKQYSVIIIDEAHERKVNTDLLLGFISKILELRLRLSVQEYKKYGKNVKYFPLRLIIMSATLQVSNFIECGFFRTPNVVRVDSQQYKVKCYFSKETRQDYLEEVVKKCGQIQKKLPEGDVLVFLTGQEEVVEVVRMLQKKLSMIRADDQGDDDDDDDIDDGYEEDQQKEEEEQEQEQNDDQQQKQNDNQQQINEEQSDEEQNEKSKVQKKDKPSDFRILPLFSKLSQEQQQQVFSETDSSIRSFIISTNIAETSVTIPNIRYIIDSGRHKQKQYDNILDIQRLKVEWVSKQMAEQRKGRAGRLMNGVCYRLYSRTVFAGMREQNEVEIIKVPFQGVYLKMMSWGVRRVDRFPFIEKPDDQVIQAAQQQLVELGCIEWIDKDNEQDIDDGQQQYDYYELTRLGKVLAYVPLNPRFGKILLLARQSRVMGYVLLATAALTVDQLTQSYRQQTDSLEMADGDDLQYVYEQSSEEDSRRNSLKQHIQQKQIQKQIRTQKLQNMKQDIKNYKQQYKQFQNENSDLYMVVNILGLFMKQVFSQGNGQVDSDGQQFLNKYRIDRIVSQFSNEYKLVQKNLKEIYGMVLQIVGILEMMVTDSKEIVDLKQFLKQYVQPDHVQQQKISQIFVNNFYDKLARRVDFIDPKTEIKKYHYECLDTNQPVHIHPTSIIYGKKPSFLSYTHLMESNRLYMMNITNIQQKEWMFDSIINNKKQNNNVDKKSVQIEEVFYCQKRKAVVGKGNGTVGRGWTVEGVEVQLEGNKVMYNQQNYYQEGFYCFMREMFRGNVLDYFKVLSKILKYHPNNIKSNNPQSYIIRFVTQLQQNDIMSLKSLQKQFKSNPRFLLNETLQWIQNEKHQKVTKSWPPQF